MEPYHFRKVLERLGMALNLNDADLALENIVQNFTSRLETRDFETWFLSGGPQVSVLVRKANEIKKRVDGFIYGGRDTFNRMIKEFIASGNSAQYNKHNLELNLNNTDQPKFTAKVRMDAFNNRVQQLREVIAQKFKFNTSEPRNAYLLFKFKPTNKSAAALVQHINSIGLPQIRVRVEQDFIEICLETEVP